MLTNLPIYHGERVKLFFLTGCPYSGISSRSSPSAYNQPIPFLIDATYDDYGNVENFEDSPLAPLIADTLFELADEESVQKHREERPGHYRTAPDAPLTLFDVVATAQRCDMKVKIALGFIPTSYEPVTAVMIRADAFQQVVIENPREVNVDEGLEWLDKMAKLDIDDELYATNMLLSPFLEGLSRAATYSSILQPRLLLQRTMMDRNFELAKNIIEAVAQFDALDYIMMATRRVYVGQAGHGSQDGVTDEHIAIANATLAVADMLEHRWDDE